MRQPLDKHMTSNFPGLLVALGLNGAVCSDQAAVPDFRGWVCGWVGESVAQGRRAWVS